MWRANVSKHLLGNYSTATANHVPGIFDQIYKNSWNLFNFFSVNVWNIPFLNDRISITIYFK
jgi:hypothetical protein